MNSGLLVSNIPDDVKFRTKLDSARLQQCILGSTVWLLSMSWCIHPRLRAACVQGVVCWAADGGIDLRFPQSVFREAQILW